MVMFVVKTKRYFEKQTFISSIITCGYYFIDVTINYDASELLWDKLHIEKINAVFA